MLFPPNLTLMLMVSLSSVVAVAVEETNAAALETAPPTPKRYCSLSKIIYFFQVFVLATPSTLCFFTSFKLCASTLFNDNEYETNRRNSHNFVDNTVDADVDVDVDDTIVTSGSACER